MRKMIMTALAAIVLAAALAPSSALAAEQRFKAPGNKGDIPARWNMEKPDKTIHPDAAPPSAGGNGDGRNGITFGAFDSGDIVVVLGTLTGHAGMFDRAYYSSLYSYAVWSANTTPVSAVQREQCIKYRSYDSAYGLWVPSLASRGSAVRYYCRAQLGEPYDISSSKADQSRWYCSKLCWAAWRYVAGIDLDGDGGFWVWPVDLINDPATSLFGYWS